MNEQNLNPAAAGRVGLRRKALIGTAVALVLGGAVTAGTVVPVLTANAQPVVIDQPVAIPSFADVVDQVAPAVVGIRVRGEERVTMNIPGLEDLPEGFPLERFFRGMPEAQTRPTTGIGSGFFISQDGYVVTNNHVVANANEVTVILNDGTELPATLVGTDDLTDLALLKVDADQDFRYVEFATGEPRIGDWAIAVGTPFGLQSTVTAGIVSASGRQLNNNAYDDFLQIDAAVNQGNSGGPTFNLAGQVIGVNTAIYSPTGVNAGIAFAIPAAIAADVVADLRDDGNVERGWLGVQIQDLTANLATALGVTTEGGAFIAEALPTGPAQAAGIESRDVVTAINGEPVTSSNDFARKIGAFDPDTEVTLTVVRDGQTQDIAVTLAAMPAADQRVAAADAPTPPEADATTGIGIGIAETRDGVVVADLDPNGTGAANGLRQGDLIVAVGDMPIEATDDVRVAVNEAREAGRGAVLFEVEREGNTLFLAVPL